VAHPAPAGGVGGSGRWSLQNGNFNPGDKVFNPVDYRFVDSLFIGKACQCQSMDVCVFKDGLISPGNFDLFLTCDFSSAL
jgi:hypothetical protein